MVVWTLIYAWYSILPFAHPVPGTVGGMGHGLMSATEPWSGHYSVQPTLAVMMHTSQFTRVGCTYVQSSAVALGGFLDDHNSSSVVAFDCDTWVTIVIETSGVAPTVAVAPTQFQLRGVRVGVARLRQFRTCSQASFQAMPAVPVASDGGFSLSLIGSCVYTLTSSATLGTLLPDRVIPPSASFPTPYSDDFEGYEAEGTVRYFTDEAGSFNAAPMPIPESNGLGAVGANWRRGTVLEQAVTRHPINGAWWGNSEPYSLIGNSQKWTDTTVTVRAMVPADRPPSPPSPPGYGVFTGAFEAGHDFNSSGHPTPTTLDEAASFCNTSAECAGFTYPLANTSRLYFKGQDCPQNADPSWRSWVKAFSPAPVMPRPTFVRICARISSFKPDGRPPQGYCLIVDSGGSWFLAAGGKAGPMRDIPHVLSHGSLLSMPSGLETLNAAHEPLELGGTWLTLKLDVNGTKLTGTVDGVVVGTVDDATFSHGMAAIGCGWHQAYFDDFFVSASTASV